MRSHAHFISFGDDGAQAHYYGHHHAQMMPQDDDEFSSFNRSRRGNAFMFIGIAADAEYDTMPAVSLRCKSATTARRRDIAGQAAILGDRGGATQAVEYFSGRHALFI